MVFRCTTSWPRRPTLLKSKPCQLAFTRTEYLADCVRRAELLPDLVGSSGGLSLEKDLRSCRHQYAEKTDTT
jgi:hypothetical protein